MMSEACDAWQRGGEESPRFHLRHAIDESVQRGWPLVMAVLNVTPDSFSDGGLFIEPSRAIEQAMAFVEEGADIIDVGGESTRPGSEPVSPDVELQRIVPIVEALAGEGVAVSIDTSK